MKYWIHMAVSEANSRKIALEAEQQKRLPDNRLSVTNNIAGTECVVKVDGDIDKAALSGKVIRIYDETDHDELLPMMRGPAWSVDEIR